MISSDADYYNNSPIAQLPQQDSRANPSSAQNLKADAEADAEELLIEEDSTEEDGSEFDSANRQIFSDKSDPSVSDLYIRYKEGELMLQPDFQRQFIWDAKKCSRLIESCILEVPLPMIYFARTDQYPICANSGRILLQ